MVRIVTDSVSDIPPVVAQELGITIVPLYVHFGTEVYRDGVNLSTEEFYRRLASSRVLPSTAAPTPTEFARAYDRLARETSEILSIHLSSKVSTTYDMALRGKEQMKEACRVEVLDSLQAIMAEGLLAIAAAQEARAGKSLEQIADMVRRAVPHTHTYACLETLEPLARGGRIGKAGALSGSIVKVRSILRLQDGEPNPVGRERSWARATHRLFELVQGFNGRIRGLAVEYATQPLEAKKLAQHLDLIFPQERIYISQLNPTVGTHTGPRALAVSVLEETAE